MTHRRSWGTPQDSQSQEKKHDLPGTAAKTCSPKPSFSQGIPCQPTTHERSLYPLRSTGGQTIACVINGIMIPLHLGYQSTVPLLPYSLFLPRARLKARTHVLPGSGQTALGPGQWNSTRFDPKSLDVNLKEQSQLNGSSPSNSINAGET